MKALSSTVHNLEEVLATPIHYQKTASCGARLADLLSNLVHLHLQTPSHKKFTYSYSNYLDCGVPMSPMTSPKEDISKKWREIHGSCNWNTLLNPLHPWLRREIVKYGEFVQATYDAFNFDSFSENCGRCIYNRHDLFDKLGLKKNGYIVTKYIYGMSHIDMPGWLKMSHLADPWSKDSNWIGYVAVSNDTESRRIGRRDIVVAWRGTVTPSEWLEDLQDKMEKIGDGNVKVERGFYSIYTSKSESTRYNKSSASDQVMKGITRLVSLYTQKGEEVSLTITGHSLGAALALLNAYEAAASLPDLPISVISFGGPRVGNVAFRDNLHKMRVKTLRVVVKQDIVPKVPGLLFNEGLQKLYQITGTLKWVYTHVGAELKLDAHASPYLKHGFNLPGFHSLETYLHLVDGFHSTTSKFRSDARRDIALVNKARGMLVDELRIPKGWYKLAKKGLVHHAYGRWVKPIRRDSKPY
ncbi:hypothetical protein HHK36_004884 [Tetracentron sinense]|uniref:Fungal lipase-type domain-containing protein n=1 Tax=Tetracentron sinense TaxID=13715 RepID=A0A834ZJY1_TETSI|nr:hypothetical protein HHK36_004884 [Tetracentron sinense]